MFGRKPVLVVGVFLAVGVVAGCSSGGDDESSSAGGSSEDFSARFDQYEVADEPEGDLSKVEWPEYVTDADPEVQSLYEFQVTHGELMRYMPCFCGCGDNVGHRNNRDCFIEEVRDNGSVEFDPMAPSCGVCLGVAAQSREMLEEGSSPREIRAAIDTQYADSIDTSTPTPYPPA
jgi:hypothetical protein